MQQSHDFPVASSPAMAMSRSARRPPRLRAGGRAAGLLAAVALLLSLAACDRGGSGGEDPLRPGALEGRLRWEVPADIAEAAGADEGIDSTRALAGVRVLLGGTDRVARTDSGGRFRFDGVAPGAYELLVDAEPPAPPSVFGPYAVRPGQGTAAGELVVADMAFMTSGASLTGEAGFVVPPDERGARLELTLVTGGAARTHLAEPDATFLLEGLPVGGAILYARGPAGWEVVTRSLVLRPGLNVLDEPLLVGPLDPARTAVALDADDRAIGLARARATNAADGEEAILGTLLLDIPADARPGAWAVTTVTLDTPTPSIAGVDERGRFRFPAVGPGTYHLSLDSALLELPEPVRVDVEPRQNTVVVLYARYLGEVPDGVAVDAALEPVDATADASTATLFGRVVVAQLDALAGARVALAGTSFAATPDRTGRFVLADVPVPATYDLVANAPGHVPFGPTPVTLAAPGSYDLGTLALASDVKRPRVLSSDPRDGARDLLVDYVVPVTITFDQAMDAASVKAALRITPPVSFRAFMGREAPTTSDRSLLVELDGVQSGTPLAFGQAYTLSLAASARNLEGVTMEAPFTLRFTTARPSVIDSYPAEGTSGTLISVNEALVVYTNAPIDPSTVDERLVRIRPNRSGSSAILRATTDAATGWGILEVRYPFEPNTDYTVTIGSRLRTTSRVTFANLPYTLRFRTGDVTTRALDDIGSRGRRVRRGPAPLPGEGTPAAPK